MFADEFDRRIDIAYREGVAQTVILQDRKAKTTSATGINTNPSSRWSNQTLNTFITSSPR